MLLLHLPFFVIATPTAATYTLSLHDALPISQRTQPSCELIRNLTIAAEPQIVGRATRRGTHRPPRRSRARTAVDRKSTRLNSSHRTISYAVFCLKKKKKTQKTMNERRRNNTS